MYEKGYNLNSVTNNISITHNKQSIKTENKPLQNFEFLEIFKEKEFSSINHNHKTNASINTSTSLKMPNLFSVKKYDLNDKDDIKACTKSYRNMTDCSIDFKRNYPNVYTGDYIHEYDLSKLHDSYNLPIKDGKVFGYTSSNNTYNIFIRLKGDKNYSLKVSGWPKDKEMDQKTFENIVIKGLQITMAEERQIGKITGKKNKLFASAPIIYDPNTKKADFSKMINSSLDSIRSRVERINGYFNENIAKQYINEFLMEINKIWKKYS